MLKLLRWLLVVLLPLVGLFGVWWLMPDAKPRWTTKFDHEITPLGYAEKEHLFLVAESGNNIIKSLIALDIQSGKVAHQAKAPVLDDKNVQYRQVSLYDDSHQVFLIPEPQRDGNEHLIVFDWLNQRIIERYQSSMSEHGALNRPVRRGSTLVAHGGRGNTLNFVIWDDAEKSPVNVIPCASAYNNFAIDLSDTGLMANVIVREPSNNCILLIDIKKQAIVQTIAGVFHEVHWASDDRSFFAVELDQKQSLLVGRKYVLGEEGFSTKDEAVLSFGINSDPPFLNRPFITFSHRSLSDSWRIKIERVLGPHFQFILDRLWPMGQVTQLRDKNDGRLLHRFVSSASNSWYQWPFPNQSGTAMILTDGKSVEYWEIYPFHRWYPAFGLFMGLILSMFFVWRWQKRRDRSTLPGHVSKQG